MKESNALRLGIISIALAAFVFAHHVWVHGYLYDPHNLFSHEAIATFLIGAGLAFIACWARMRKSD
ncbi:MAG: hypothetical protein QXG10_05415 [Candidatus Hadarchaeales archaeon]